MTGMFQSASGARDDGDRRSRRLARSTSQRVTAGDGLGFICVGGRVGGAGVGLVSRLSSRRCGRSAARPAARPRAGASRRGTPRGHRARSAADHRAFCRRAPSPSSDHLRSEAALTPRNPAASLTLRNLCAASMFPSRSVDPLQKRGKLRTVGGVGSRTEPPPQGLIGRCVSDAQLRWTEPAQDRTSPEKSDETCKTCASLCRARTRRVQVARRAATCRGGCPSALASGSRGLPARATRARA